MLEHFKLTDVQATRLLIYEIRDRNPDAVKFVIDESTCKTVHFYLMTKKFDTIMYLFGHSFLLEIMKTLEQFEIYEGCAEIVKQIQEHNKLVNDNLKTEI